MDKDSAPPSRGTLDRNKRWANGAVLKVKFLNGTTFQKQKVREIAPEWSRFANVSFQFVENGKADIRISFNRNMEGDSYSYIGTDARSIPEQNETMFLTIYSDSTLRYYSRSNLKSTVLHEFGHALGLLHEHKSPLSKIKWNRDTLYKYYALPPNGWTREEVNRQVLEVLDVSYTNNKYDPKSVMHYHIDPAFTLDNYSVGLNSEISEGDKETISSLYPRQQVTTQSFDVNTSMCAAPSYLSDGFLYIYPVFTITNAQSLQIRVMAYLYDENKRAIRSSNVNYQTTTNSLVSSTLSLQPCCPSTIFNESAFANSVKVPVANLIPRTGSRKIYFSFGIWSGGNLIFDGPYYEVFLAR